MFDPVVWVGLICNVVKQMFGRLVVVVAVAVQYRIGVVLQWNLHQTASTIVVVIVVAVAVERALNNNNGS